MQKIPSLFVRDPLTRKVVDQVVPGSEWVISGQGWGTRKWDGLAVLVKNSLVFKRHHSKFGRVLPPTFIPAQMAPDPVSGHWPGWVPATGLDSRRELAGIRWGTENLFNGKMVPDGTYEVCGPTIGTRHGVNPENLNEIILCAHGSDVIYSPRNYLELKSHLRESTIEGIVWHHANGSMVKIKKSDFDHTMP